MLLTTGHNTSHKLIGSGRKGVGQCFTSRNQGQNLETTVGTLEILGFTSVLKTKNRAGYVLEKRRRQPWLLRVPCNLSPDLGWVIGQNQSFFFF